MKEDVPGNNGFHAKVSSSPAGKSNETTQALPTTTKSSCTDNVRVEWNNMADADKLSYVKSVKCLIDAKPLGVWANATSIWDEITWVHDQLSELIHGVDTFLPWHRYYLHMLKTLLKEHCSYTGPMPWWRETNYTGNFAGSGLFTAEYFGSLPPLSDDFEGTCITDGAFANTTIRVGPYDGPTCLSRGETKQTTDEITVDYVNLCHGTMGTEYTQHRRCLEQTIHALMHEGIGPTMWLLSTSPGDPLFFMHHGFVDWQWKRWQDVNPERSSLISGCAEYTGDGGPCVPLTLDTVLTTMGLVPNMTVGDVLDTENGVMCYTYDEF
ncbi:tyrosinase-like protein [Cladorrhinum sp. PSN259]|nr:tyrosinase-like protein [Cladorrhinum sp. PSN259]